MGNENSIRKNSFDAVINNFADSFLKARVDGAVYSGIFLYGGNGSWRKVKRDLVNRIDEKGFFIDAIYRRSQKDFDFKKRSYYPIDLSSFFPRERDD
jgi:hypothetical protein